VIEDIVSEILSSLPTRISDVVTQWAERTPGHPALVESSGTWTYRQLAESVAEAKVWLGHCGIRPGDRVMVVSENCRAFVAILLALSSIDAWPVLVNPVLSAREIDQIRDHSGSRRAIYITSVSPHAAQHAKRHGAAVAKIGSLGPLSLGPLNEDVEPEILEGDSGNNVAALIYTSGTTGLPKGVMLSHRNVLFVAAVSAKIRSLSPDDRFFSVLPMTHAVGLSVVLLGTLFSGATLYLSSRFDPVATVATLKTDHVTVMLGAPAMFSLLLRYVRSKGIRSFEVPSLRIIASSSAPLDPELKKDVESFFGMVLHNGYGATECSPTIAQTRVESPRTDTAVGRVFPGVQVKLAGPDRQPVIEGEIGEVWVRGPNVMRGYYRAPEETASAIDAEGWFNTRDLARLEGENLFIVGRTKELIIRFGFNVYPVEIEAVLNAHPAVVRSAVIGRSSKSTEGDEEVIAFVQLAPGSSVSSTELSEYAAAYLAPYKRPSQILLVSAMPLTPTGKIVKDELAKMALLNSHAASAARTQL